MVYFTRLWKNLFSFQSLPFRIDRWLISLPKGWKVSFGFWGRPTLYSPLGEGQIRLLRLHPGQSQDVVNTTLLAVDLAEAPPYEALSYAWGSFQERSSLLIDGNPVEIHSGLFDAIHTLRSPTSERLIWADAICINQYDMEERNHQVKIMSEIYHSAKSVTVYLGKSSGRTEEGMQALQFFLDARSPLEHPPWESSTTLEVELGLMDIIGRPWFERIWTVQEATLARHTTFVCGDHQVAYRVDLRTMRSIVFRIKSSATSPYFSTSTDEMRRLDWSPLLMILETQLRQAARREGVVLRRNHLDLAFDFRQRISTDPRDKYYAIFGIVENDQGGNLVLQPDYSTRLEELHRSFTAEIQRTITSELADVGLQGSMDHPLHCDGESDNVETMKPRSFTKSRRTFYSAGHKRYKLRKFVRETVLRQNS
ncbi:HET-domain-containing protein [Lophiostoma macrostomum CBS 122681]|uniref:HET-domain-containing protein n=1 Tax=Lophiostoma macrostomum CBS 122681 TaxID=1314788 RepID=A0A6A6TTX4_9PLEO|nr:HET-domain-containing protein [Lophiostoma macrostomum CBS 122681]